MSRFSLAATLAFTLLACSSIWADEVQLAPQTLNLDGADAVLDIVATLKGDSPMPCGELEAFLSLKWDGEAEVPFRLLGTEGDAIDMGVMEAGPSEVATQEQRWTEVDAGTCEAKFTVVFEASDTPQSGQLTISVLAQDTSSSPDDNPDNAVMEAGLVVVDAS